MSMQKRRGQGFIGQVEEATPVMKTEKGFAEIGAKPAQSVANVLKHDHLQYLKSNA